MKHLWLLFALCIPAHAALPPSPEPYLRGVSRQEWQSLGWRYNQPVPRPAPLQSPKAASVPKSAPMAKTFKVASSSEPSTVFVSLTYGVNIDGCDTNDVNCLTWDQTHVWAQQKAGYNMTIEYTDKLGSGSWAWLSMTGAAPYDRQVDVYRLLRSWQRPQAEIFRTVQTIAPTGTMTAASGGRRINPAAKGWFFK